MIYSLLPDPTIPIAFVAAGICLSLMKLYLSRPSVVGAAGERRVNKYLNKTLNAEHYTLLKDLTLPTGDGTTQIDHVVLSQHGIFVIETKNMSGWIFGTEKQKRWTQTKGRRKTPFQNPLRQNYLHVKTIQDILSVPDAAIHNLVVFVGSAKAKTAMPDTVLWSPKALAKHILTQEEVSFSPEEYLDHTVKLLSVALASNAKTERTHIQHVKAKIKQAEGNSAALPQMRA